MHKIKAHIHRAHGFYRTHRKHFIAVLSFGVVIVHFVLPEGEVIATAIVGFVSVEFV